jgi:DNA-binding response OmpR family regulator
VDNSVKRLRRKLGTATWIIETVRGAGYRVTHPAALAELAPAV